PAGQRLLVVDTLQRAPFLCAQRPQALFARHQEQDTESQPGRLAHDPCAERSASRNATVELAAGAEGRRLLPLHSSLLAEDAGRRRLVDAARGAENELTRDSG